MRGARLALTYQGERLEENVRDLAAGLQPIRWCFPCDVTDDAQIARVFAEIDREFGGLDFVVHGAAFAPREELSEPFVQTTREGFRMALDISAYSLIALARARAAADGEARRRQHPDADLSWQRARLPELQRHGRGQGGARVDGPLSGGRSRPEEHPRQRDFGRSDQDARGRGHLAASRASCRSTAIARRCAARWSTAEVADAAMFLLSDAGRGVTAEVLMVDGGYHAIGM